MLNLIVEYTKSYIRELMRNRSAAFFTLFFPAILLLLFGHNTATNHSAGSQTVQLMSFIIYCNYAVQAVMLQALGIAIATEKNSPWRDYLQTLPVSKTPWIAGRILSTLFFSCISLSLVILASYFCNRSDLSFSITRQGDIILCALLGGIPMALLAIFLGKLLNATAARSAFVLLNLALLFGSFALPSSGMIGWVQEGILSYQWMLFSLGVSTQQFSIFPLIWLAGYAVLFYCLIQVDFLILFRPHAVKKGSQ